MSATQRHASAAVVDQTQQVIAIEAQVLPARAASPTDEKMDSTLPSNNEIVECLATGEFSPCSSCRESGTTVSPKTTCRDHRLFTKEPQHASGSCSAALEVTEELVRLVMERPDRCITLEDVAEEANAAFDAEAARDALFATDGDDHTMISDIVEALGCVAQNGDDKNDSFGVSCEATSSAMRDPPGGTSESQKKLEEEEDSSVSTLERTEKALQESAMQLQESALQLEESALQLQQVLVDESFEVASRECLAEQDVEDQPWELVDESFVPASRGHLAEQDVEGQPRCKSLAHLAQEVFGQTPPLRGFVKKAGARRQIHVSAPIEGVAVGRSGVHLPQARAAKERHDESATGWKFRNRSNKECDKEGMPVEFACQHTRCSSSESTMVSTDDDMFSKGCNSQGCNGYESWKLEPAGEWRKLEPASQSEQRLGVAEEKTFPWDRLFSLANSILSDEASDGVCV
jgi:hypothetical protein